MLSCLRPTKCQREFVALGAEILHLSITSRNHDDCAVHESSASDHVLDVISVSRAVDMRVMAVAGLVFNMRSCDRDTTFSLFRSFVDLSIVQKLSPSLLGLSFGYGSSEGRLGE